LRKEKKKRTTFHKSAFWIISLLAVLIFISAWWLWHEIENRRPRVDHILLRINGEPQKILPGETLIIHPRDKIRIMDISTNIPFNFGIRLVAKDFDVGALRYGETIFSELLPGKEVFDHYRFRILIKQRNRNVGQMIWEVRPYAEEWLDKADRVIDPTRRLGVLERAKSFLPGDRIIRRRLINEYKQLKKWDRAAMILEQMAKTEPDADILRELVEIYKVSNQKKKLISALKRLIGLDPGDIETQKRLAETLEETGQLREAIRAYEILLKAVEKQERLNLYKNLGYLYSKIGQTGKAIDFYSRAKELDRKDANLYYNLSHLYEKNDQRVKADFYLEKALNLKSGDIEGRLKLVPRLIERGELKKAIKYTAQVLDKNPDSVEALLLMAKLMDKKGDKQELKKIYRKLLALDPQNEILIYNMGALEYERGDLVSSLKYFERYIKLQPKDTAVHKILFDIYKKQKREDMAFKEAKTLIELQPSELDPYYYVFDYLNAQEAYEEIFHIMNNGLKSNPDETALREYLLLACLKTGRDEDAIEQIERILKEKPDDISLLLNLARLSEKTGRLSKALEAYKDIIKISPGNEEAEESYLRLRLKGVRGERDG